MPALAPGLDYVDVRFLGQPSLIATAILHGPGGVALIDPGPSTTLGHLEGALAQKGIGLVDVREILLTHIHLDHAGSTGSILERYPGIDVLVHERGAPHLIDPSKLLTSAGRLYGQDMDRLWGTVKPVPAARVRPLSGGERLTVAGRDLAVASTPGHAVHHVSYFDAASRVAFVGDTAGIRRGSGNYVLPPTPPPDIDLEAWRASQDRILAWDPDTLFLTHFGPFSGARPQFGELFAHLAEWSRSVQRLVADEALDEPRRQEAFVSEAWLDLRRTVGEREADLYVAAGGLGYSWQGLARYWRKRWHPH
ncbi:MAG TPA: MBL fold metallo-hydrolase [Vicinamibacterales bacterium]|nr:MBL fold metallo-hydrolase [Vicinamibacterales bacterium]